MSFEADAQDLFRLAGERMDCITGLIDAQKDMIVLVSDRGKSLETLVVSQAGVIKAQAEVLDALTKRLSHLEGFIESQNKEIQKLAQWVQDGGGRDAKS